MNFTKLSWRNILAFLLSAFFLLGAIGNFTAFGNIAEEYARWGYPHWFHYITALIEFSSSALIARLSTRFWGGLLGCSAMIGASTTVLAHGEYLHSIPPLLILVAVSIVTWINRPRRC